MFPPGPREVHSGCSSSVCRWLCLSGMWSVAWREVQKPFHVFPVYPCVAQAAARGRQGIYSWNIWCWCRLPEAVSDSFRFSGLHETAPGFCAPGRAPWVSASLPLVFAVDFPLKYALPFGFCVGSAPSGSGALRALRKFKEWLVWDHRSLVSFPKPFHWINRVIYSSPLEPGQPPVLGNYCRAAGNQCCGNSLELREVGSTGITL